MWPKPRLGKRSPLGVLLGAPYPAGGAPTGWDPAEGSTASATGAGQHHSGRVKGHPVLKGGGEGRGGGGVEPTAVISERCDRPHPDVSPCGRPASASIDVPRRRGRRWPEQVDVDELMAAMVLSSLSGSPLLHGPAHLSPAHLGHAPLSPAVPPTDCRGSELSDGGCSCSSSGSWSGSRGTGSPATPPDGGLEAESEGVASHEPAMHSKRRNPALRCLWPGCKKTLTTVVGIRRHIRMTHLGEHERSEEDFYYTEASRSESPPSPTLPVPSSPALPPSPRSPLPSSPALSGSAPSSFSASWQVHSDHSYQSLPSRMHALTAAEQWLQPHSSAPWRRVRGEAKKCRRVYGLDQRERWCTACRWKKACQRFLH